jgi:hypothetical protein
LNSKGSTSARGVSGAAAQAVTAEHVLHLILELQLAFLEGGFFELLGFRKEVAAGQAMYLLVEVVVLRD